MLTLVRSTLVLLVVLVALAVTSAGAFAQEALNATVIRVSDGDTLVARLQSGGVETVRLLGIGASESVDPDNRSSVVPDTLRVVWLSWSRGGPSC